MAKLTRTLGNSIIASHISKSERSLIPKTAPTETDMFNV
jgi:hypothetical protein